MELDKCDVSDDCEFNSDNCGIQKSRCSTPEPVKEQELSQIAMNDKQSDAKAEEEEEAVNNNFGTSQEELEITEATSADYRSFSGNENTMVNKVTLSGHKKKSDPTWISSDEFSMKNHRRNTRGQSASLERMFEENLKTENKDGLSNERTLTTPKKSTLTVNSRGEEFNVDCSPEKVSETMSAVDEDSSGGPLKKYEVNDTTSMSSVGMTSVIGTTVAKCARNLSELSPPENNHSQEFMDSVISIPNKTSSFSDSRCEEMNMEESSFQEDEEANYDEEEESNKTTNDTTVSFNSAFRKRRSTGILQNVGTPSSVYRTRQSACTPLNRLGVNRNSADVGNNSSPPRISYGNNATVRFKKSSERKSTPFKSNTSKKSSIRDSVQLKLTIFESNDREQTGDVEDAFDVGSSNDSRYKYVSTRKKRNFAEENTITEENDGDSLIEASFCNKFIEDLLTDDADITMSTRIIVNKNTTLSNDFDDTEDENINDTIDVLNKQSELKESLVSNKRLELKSILTPLAKSNFSVKDKSAKKVTFNLPQSVDCTFANMQNESELEESVGYTNSGVEDSVSSTTAGVDNMDSYSNSDITDDEALYVPDKSESDNGCSYNTISSIGENESFADVTFDGENTTINSSSCGYGRLSGIKRLMKTPEPDSFTIDSPNNSSSVKKVKTNDSKVSLFSERLDESSSKPIQFLEEPKRARERSQTPEACLSGIIRLMETPELSVTAATEVERCGDISDSLEDPRKRSSVKTRKSIVNSRGSAKSVKSLSRRSSKNSSYNFVNATTKKNGGRLYKSLNTEEIKDRGLNARASKCSTACTDSAGLSSSLPADVETKISEETQNNQSVLTSNGWNSYQNIPDIVITECIILSKSVNETAVNEKSNQVILENVLVATATELKSPQIERSSIKSVNENSETLSLIGSLDTTEKFVSLESKLLKESENMKDINEDSLRSSPSSPCQSGLENSPRAEQGSGNSVTNTPDQMEGSNIQEENSQREEPIIDASSISESDILILYNSNELLMNDVRGREEEVKASENVSPRTDCVPCEAEEKSTVTNVLLEKKIETEEASFTSNDEDVAPEVSVNIMEISGVSAISSESSEIRDVHTDKFSIERELSRISKVEIAEEFSKSNIAVFSTPHSYRCISTEKIDSSEAYRRCSSHSRIHRSLSLTAVAVSSEHDCTASSLETSDFENENSALAGTSESFVPDNESGIIGDPSDTELRRTITEQRELDYKVAYNEVLAELKEVLRKKNEKREVAPEKKEYEKNSVAANLIGSSFEVNGSQKFDYDAAATSSVLRLDDETNESEKSDADKVFEVSSMEVGATEMEQANQELPSKNVEEILYATQTEHAQMENEKCAIITMGIDESNECQISEATVKVGVTEVVALNDKVVEQVEVNQIVGVPTDSEVIAAVSDQPEAQSNQEGQFSGSQIDDETNSTDTIKIHNETGNRTPETSKEVAVQTDNDMKCHTCSESKILEKNLIRLNMEQSILHVSETNTANDDKMSSNDMDNQVQLDQNDNAHEAGTEKSQASVILFHATGSNERSLRSRKDVKKADSESLESHTGSRNNDKLVPTRLRPIRNIRQSLKTNDENKPLKKNKLHTDENITQKQEVVSRVPTSKSKKKTNIEKIELPITQLTNPNVLLENEDGEKVKKLKNIENIVVEDVHQGKEIPKRKADTKTETVNLIENVTRRNTRNKVPDFKKKCTVVLPTMDSVIEKDENLRNSLQKIEAAIVEITVDAAKRPRRNALPQKVETAVNLVTDDSTSRARIRKTVIRSEETEKSTRGAAVKKTMENASIRRSSRNLRSVQVYGTGEADIGKTRETVKSRTATRSTKKPTTGNTAAIVTSSEGNDRAAVKKKVQIASTQEEKNTNISESLLPKRRTRTTKQQSDEKGDSLRIVLNSGSEVQQLFKGQMATNTRTSRKRKIEGAAVGLFTKNVPNNAVTFSGGLENENKDEDTDSENEEQPRKRKIQITKSSVVKTKPVTIVKESKLAVEAKSKRLSLRARRKKGDSTKLIAVKKSGPTSKKVTNEKSPKEEQVARVTRSRNKNLSPVKAIPVSRRR